MKEEPAFQLFRVAVKGIAMVGLVALATPILMRQDAEPHTYHEQKGLDSQIGRAAIEVVFSVAPGAWSTFKIGDTGPEPPLGPFLLA